MELTLTNQAMDIRALGSKWRHRHQAIGHIRIHHKWRLLKPQFITIIWLLYINLATWVERMSSTSHTVVHLRSRLRRAGQWQEDSTCEARGHSTATASSHSRCKTLRDSLSTRSLKIPTSMWPTERCTQQVTRAVRSREWLKTE